MLQKYTYGFILLTGIVFLTSNGVQIDLCVVSSGVISHVSKAKYVHQWLLVGKKCETPGSVLLLRLISTNLTCDKGDMSLGISAFGDIPNLCSFRRGGCFVVSSSTNSSFGCRREQIIYRDNVMPVAIALSKTASEVDRGFEIRFQFVTGSGDDTNGPPSEAAAPTTTKAELVPITTEASVVQSPAMPTQQEPSSLNSHAVSNAIVYLSLTIAFGILLSIALLILAALAFRLSRSTGKETKADLSKTY